MANGVIKSLVHQLITGNEVVKEEAAQKIKELATDKNNHLIISREGAIKPLLQLLQNGNEGMKDKAMSAILNLSFNEENRIIIVNERGLNPIIHLIITSSHIIQIKAAATLWNLSFNPNNQIIIANFGAINPLIQLLSFGGAELLKEKVVATLWNLSLNAENKVIITKEGGVKPLIQLLSSVSEKIKDNAAAVLWNLAVNNDNQIIIGKEGGIKPLVNLLERGSDIQKERAAGALQNLAANNENITIMIKEGAIKVLAKALITGTQKTKETAGSALFKIAGVDKNEVGEEIKRINILPPQILDPSLKALIISYNSNSNSNNNNNNTIKTPPSPRILTIPSPSLYPSLSSSASSPISPSLSSSSNNLYQSWEGVPDLGVFDGEWLGDIPTLIDSKIQPLSSRYRLEVLRMKNLAHQNMFHGSIHKCEQRLTTDLFKPQMETESQANLRLEVLNRIENHEALVLHNRDRRVRVMRVWHGTSFSKAKSITAIGFANLATLDDGWFGKGIYFTTSPEYALNYCRDEDEPCLIMCHVILLNPFPVIWDDAQSIETLRFAGKPNYKNYECHFIPVVQHGKVDFRPPRPGQKATFEEIVMFQESHILVHSLVVLNSK